MSESVRGTRTRDDGGPCEAKPRSLGHDSGWTVLLSRSSKPSISFQQTLAGAGTPSSVQREELTSKHLELG